MRNFISSDDCIDLSKGDAQASAKNVPRITEGNDPRSDVFSTVGKNAMATGTLQQRGLLIVNDGNDVDTDVWSRLNLAGRVPIEALPEKVLIDRLLNNPEIRACLEAATVVIAPRKAGPRLFDAMQKYDPAVFKNMRRLVTPQLERPWDALRRAQVTISPDQADNIKRSSNENDSVVILDDVASTYQTSSIISQCIDKARRINLVTLVAVNPKEEEMPLVQAAKFSNSFAAIASKYKGGREKDRPAITTTAGIFDGTEKAERSKANIRRYLQDGGLALDILQKRLQRDFGLGFFDLDGTLLIDGRMSETLRSTLLDLREKMFLVVATGRSSQQFDQLQPNIRELFQAYILENGANVRVKGRDKKTIERGVNANELESLTKKIARKTGVQMLATFGKDIPLWLRIRAAGGNITSGEFTAEDTSAAFAFTDAFNDEKTKFAAQASGNGDVVIAWPETDKGRSGIDGLARRLPTLPSLNNAIAAGDGPNDAVLLNRIREAGGTSIAVGRVCDPVRNAASEILTSQNKLAPRLQRLFIKQEINRALASAPLLPAFAF